MEYSKQLTLIIPERKTVKEPILEDMINNRLKVERKNKKKKLFFTPKNRKKGFDKMRNKQVKIPMQWNFLNDRNENHTYMYVDMNNIYINYAPKEKLNNDNETVKRKKLNSLSAFGENLESSNNLDNQVLDSADDLRKLFSSLQPGNRNNENYENENNVLISIVGALKNTYSSSNIKDNFDNTLDQWQYLFKAEKKDKQENLLLKSMLNSLLLILQNMGIKTTGDFNHNNDIDNHNKIDDKQIARHRINENGVQYIFLPNVSPAITTTTTTHVYDKLYEVFTKSTLENLAHNSTTTTTASPARTYRIDHNKIDQQTTKPGTIYKNKKNHVKSGDYRKDREVTAKSVFTFEDECVLSNRRWNFHWLNFTEDNHNNLKRNTRDLISIDKSIKNLFENNKKNKYKINKRLFNFLTTATVDNSVTECHASTPSCGEQIKTTTRKFRKKTNRRSKIVNNNVTTSTPVPIEDNNLATVSLCSGSAVCPVCNKTFKFQLKSNARLARSLAKKPILSWKSRQER